VIIETPPSDETNLGDDPAQLCRIDDAIEAHLRHMHEEKEEAKMALKKAQEDIIEQCQVAKKEKEDLQTKFE
jgi:hypothetical protein